MESGIKIIKENYPWIIAVSTFLFGIFKGFGTFKSKRKILKVRKDIAISEDDFFEFDYIHNKLKIDATELRDILRVLELEGIIKDSPIDGARKYHFFYRI